MAEKTSAKTTPGTTTANTSASGSVQSLALDTTYKAGDVSFANNTEQGQHSVPFLAYLLGAIACGFLYAASAP